jgi:ribose 5-phosphate isomerase
MNTTDDRKKLCGEKAAEFVQDGMAIGLGTGSTVYWTILKIGEMVADGLSIRAIPTSKQTEKIAVEHGIELCTFTDVDRLDLTIDGADELNPPLDLIKGGGGALLREKLVAAASDRLIIVADESKYVEMLGVFPLPVEVISIRLANYGAAYRKFKYSAKSATDGGRSVCNRQRQLYSRLPLRADSESS